MSDWIEMEKTNDTLLAVRSSWSGRFPDEAHFFPSNTTFLRGINNAFDSSRSPNDEDARDE